VVGSSAIQLQVGYGYDGAGHITSIQYPSGRVLSIPHTGGLPASMSLSLGGSALPLLTQIAHEPFGAVKTWNWAATTGEQPHERVFDTSGRAVRYALGPFVRDLSYDAADRITAHTHMDRAGVATAAAVALNQGFGYDELGRLTSSTGAYTASYGYDANGNRTSATTPGTAGTSARSYTVEPTSNRITALSNPPRAITFDAAGNTYTDGEPSPGWTAGYDMANRLTAIQVNRGGGVWECSNYLYDAFGMRVAKLWRSIAVRSARDGCGTAGPPNTATIYVHDPQGQLLGEYRATDGAPLKEYVWLGATPVAVVVYDTASAASGEVMFIHTDHLDTPRVIQDRAGRTRWTWLAEPFGNQAPNQNPQSLGELSFNLRMPGQYFDREVNLFYNRARLYDAGIGRYVTSDPIGLEGGINTYAYAFSQPTALTDPNGLNPGAGCLAGAWAGPLGCGVGAAGGALVMGGAILMSEPGRKAIKSIAQKIEDLCRREEKDPCEQQYEDDESDCFENYGKVFGYSHFSFQGCMQNAKTRREQCKKGLPQIPKWGDGHVTGQPRISPRNKP
jgi:RHS repeat-associated protein